MESYQAALSSVIDEQRYLAMISRPSLEKIRDSVLNNIRTGAAHYVAVSGGQVLGWCVIAVDPLRGRHAHTGGLGIGVADSWRGRGLGRELISVAIKHAREAGLLRIELSVYDSKQAGATDV